jgi:hypothetical protein
MQMEVVARANSLLLLAGLLLGSVGACQPARAQLIGLPPLPTKRLKNQQKQRVHDFEWMWQYGPPPEGGREHEFIQDTHFRPFLQKNFTAPQSFWGLQPDNVKDPRRKSLPDTIEDFLDVPGNVTADDNRYITVTGAVFHFSTSRGLLFADLDSPDPLLAFAAIDWIRDGHTPSEADAQYTLWIFTNRPMGTADNPFALPPAFSRSLMRWVETPLAGSGILQKIRAAILVEPDGIPHQITVPRNGAAPVDSAPQLPRRSPS